MKRNSALRHWMRSRITVTVAGAVVSLGCIFQYIAVVFAIPPLVFREGADGAALAATGNSSAAELTACTGQCGADCTAFEKISLKTGLAASWLLIFLVDLRFVELRKSKVDEHVKNGAVPTSRVLPDVLTSSA